MDILNDIYLPKEQVDLWAFVTLQCNKNKIKNKLMKAFVPPLKNKSPPTKSSSSRTGAQCPRGHKYLMSFSSGIHFLYFSRQSHKCTELQEGLRLYLC